MDHLEAIVEIKNIISPEFIDKIIPLTDHKAKEKLKISEGLNKDIRNVKGHHLTFNTPTDLFYWNYIKNEIEKSIDSFLYSGIEWRPQTYLNISRDESDAVIKMLETLEDDDDVQNTFVNCNIHIN